jgi:DNA (cytosine-5)-methyltransferase 1
MRNDYRNYLFEKYIDVVKHYRPKAFIFENVPGILSAAPGNGKEKIIDIISRQFSNAGYVMLENMQNTIIDLTEYGVPQNRKRIIILGLNREIYGDESLEILERFYNELLPQYKVKKKVTVKEAIGDLPKLYPLGKPIVVGGKKTAHSFHKNPTIHNHRARYNSEREISTFRLLTEDIANGQNKYTSIEKLKELYTLVTGKKSNVHKYYVLRWNEPSNTIPAHLYKDGLRHIHPDPEQSRTITVREAARLQTFPDDYEFISNTAMDYKSIGNAVPPLFAKILAEILTSILSFQAPLPDKRPYNPHTAHIPEN